MSPTDSHVWASTAKTTVGTVVAMLVEEGKVDPEKGITHYVPELKGTNWEGIIGASGAQYVYGVR